MNDNSDNFKTATDISSQGFEYGVKHFYNPKSGIVTEILFNTLGLAEYEATALLNLGAVYVNNQRLMLNNHLAENQLFRVHTKPRRYGIDYQWLHLIVYENSDFIVVNKPSGLPSHPSVDNAIENSLTQCSLALGTQLLITHRLDTLTEGLIVYAKKSEFVKQFNWQLQNRLIEKFYCAVVESKNPLPSKLIHYMEPSPRAPKKLSDSYQENWALCELEIIEQRALQSGRWLKINLITGRTHQIRAQLAHTQSPILGDTLYGSQSNYQTARPSPGIALRACEMRFNWGQQRLCFNLSEDFDL